MTFWEQSGSISKLWGRVDLDTNYAMLSRHREGVSTLSNELLSKYRVLMFTRVTPDYAGVPLDIYLLPSRVKNCICG
jgi:hypothetical protein